MGWREIMGVEASTQLSGIRKTGTIHTKPPSKDEKDPQKPSSVCIVPDSLIPPKDVGGIPATEKTGSDVMDEDEGMLTFEALELITFSTKARGIVSLKPGNRLTWPEEEARRVLQYYPETLRLIETSPDWPAAWRALADMTGGIEQSDGRYLGVLALLDECDRAFDGKNWTDFKRLAEKVRFYVSRK